MNNTNTTEYLKVSNPDIITAANRALTWAGREGDKEIFIWWNWENFMAFVQLVVSTKVQDNT
jgi:hypothetical protein